MKIMWKSQVIRDRALQQVKDEVTIAVSCVDNPLIVKTWFYWQSKRFLYIITDFIENGELLSLWLRVHHLPERVVATYAVEMALALDYLHKRGIIYRDIKMENILLDKRGHVQLIDFGLSKWLPMGERTCTICGTIQYMAPEILSVEPYDHSVDWWSLGILIYALLSGEYPLNAAKDHIQMNEKVSRHIFELDHANGSYSTESRDLVRRLLRKNPQRRMKSLVECKKEPFFLKEMQAFLTCDLIEKKKITSAKEKENLTLLVNENFWNPYFIIENYSPLELLFEELSGGYGNNKVNIFVIYLCRFIRQY
jgi:serine/threonine protein kinase